MYGVGSYFLSKNLTETPALIFIPTVFCLLIYWAIQFVCIIQSLIGNALGLLIGSMFSDPKVASSFVPVTRFSPTLLFTIFNSLFSFQ